MSCNCNKPCSCSDNTENQAPACSYPSCENPEICSETSDSYCTVYTGETIANVAGSIYVPKGARVEEILQRLVGVITNPGCNLPSAPCLSPIVKVVKVTTTEIKLQWGEVSTASSYVVQYRVPGNQNWTSAAAVTTFYNTIGALTANTEYYVRVQSVSGSNTCNSVTFSIKTKS
jgi:hypothetical protein